MGVLKGSISYARFYVQGDLPEDFRDSFVETVRLRAFRPLDPNEDEEMRVGWVPIERPFESEVTLDYGDMFYNAYLNLGMRVDQWRFPGPVLKSAIADAEKRHLEKVGRVKLGRREKEEIKALVCRKLRLQFSPTMKVVDVSWNLSTGVLRFWNQSQKTHETLFEIFEKTFPVKLLPAGPYTSAPEARQKPLLELEPIVLATQPH